MTQEQRQIAILGSTGSIGQQALEVIDQNPEFFQVSVLTANRSADLLIQQALKYEPNTVVIGDEQYYQAVNEALSPKAIKVFAGRQALNEVVGLSEIDVVLTGMVGFSGLEPTIKAIEAGKTIALANKETLVVAGELITRMARENKVSIIPVDSEHSAIFQCLAGEAANPIEKIYLTASGGPFRGKGKSELEDATKEQALKHPNWDMGAKITIDSATMMNKGLEVIEAKWLFGLSKEQIDVIVHPQSIIHSLVQFKDGTLKAEMGLADMRLPIQYALAYPYRLYNNFQRFDFSDYQNLTFEKPDYETFKNLELAYQAMERGGTMACILNAANEVAVDAFLNDRITFMDIPRMNERCLGEMKVLENPALSDYFEADRATREFARTLLNTFSSETT